MTTSTIKPNQSKSILEHSWSDAYIMASDFSDEEISFEVDTFNGEAALKLNKSDAIAIARHFNLIPTIYSKADPRIGFIQSGPNTYDVVTSKEYINGELVPVVTNDDLEVGDVVQTLDSGTTYDVVEVRLTPNHKLSELNGFMSEGGE